MKITKRLFCLCLVFVIAAAGLVGFGISADAAGYATGDVIAFGSYPQTKVTDQSLLNALNAQDGEWKSYGYYSGTGTADDGWMAASDYMRYKDVTYNGAQYRAVTFDDYRPSLTGGKRVSAVYNTQEMNGYAKGGVYWFRYEPLQWRVLDPQTGLALCTTIIDSQPFNNYLLRNSAEGQSQNVYWGDAGRTYYANNYAKSSVRDWLNDVFYRTAFTASEKEDVLTTTLNNDCSYTLINHSDKYQAFDAPETNDKVFLLSYVQASNRAYGFVPYDSTHDAARCLQGSDYAKCQGLQENSDGYADWLLRTAYTTANRICAATDYGAVESSEHAYYTNHTTDGVCPAIRIDWNPTRRVQMDRVGSFQLDYKTRVIVTAEAENVPDGYVLTMYENGTKIATGDRCSVSFNAGQMTADRSFDVRVEDADGTVQKRRDGTDLAGTILVYVKTGFFARLKAFFRTLFGLIPSVEVRL